MKALTGLRACVSLFMCALAITHFACATSQNSHADVATTSIVHVRQGESLDLHAGSSALVVVALSRGTVAISHGALNVDRNRLSLEKGDHKMWDQGTEIRVTNVGSSIAELAIVKMKTVGDQQLTVERIKLDPKQILENASDQNLTLVLALDRVSLQDERSKGGEDEPWVKCDSHRIELDAGQTGWMSPGIHQVKNIGAGSAEFLMIEQ